MKPARLATVPSWIPLIVSISLSMFIISRGLDYLDPHGNAQPYLKGLRFLGFQQWGYGLVVLGVALLIASIYRVRGSYAPLFFTHMVCIFAYGALFSVVSTGDHSWVWFRALLNIAAAAAIHCGRAVSLFFERLTEGEVTDRG